MDKKEREKLMKKILYVLRHGQTMFNLQKKIQGWCDSPLSPLGIAQAEVARDYFLSQGITFDAAYSSTSERASDTLEIATNYSMPYIRLKGLKEWNFGRFEGESEGLNPQLPYRDFFVRYGGEDEREVQQRVTKTIEEIMRKNGHQSVLVATHGAAGTKFYQSYEAYAVVKKVGSFKNCSIMKYDYDSETEIFTLVEIVEHDFSSLTQ